MKKYLLIYSIYFSFVFPNDSLSEIDSLNNRLVGADTYIEKCDIYLKLGILHHDLSNFNLALESYKKVLLYENRLISDPENHTLLYSTYNSIAQVYEEWGDWDKAKINYNKCYDYCNEENNQNCIEECDDLSPVGKLDDISELLILFYWDGDLNNPIQDVDYFLWGSDQNPLDKSGISGYQNETSVIDQLYLNESTTQNYAYSRIGVDEIGELETGSNGISGHDETSENFRESWTIIRIPDFIYGCTDLYAINYNPLAEFEINTYYEHNTGLFEFNPSLSCRYSFKQIINNEFGIEYPNMVVYGRVIDFFDIRTVTESGSGPQNITIEDENGFRMTITVWDWEVADSEISEVLTEYNKNMYYVWAEGDLDYYERYGEWQIDVTSSDNIIIAQNVNPDGEYESSSTPIKTSINPEPFIIIPARDETLDYNFTFPDKSRVIVRIFDISGRFITSLIDQYYELSGTVKCNDPPASWNGRDHLGQIVAAGTYIMHIEAMNPATGETHTDAAPVVVGVKN